MPASDARDGSPSNAALALLLVLLAAWGGVFVLRSSFVLGDQRYFVLFDDAMVSMSYARSAASGDGLVWTSGNEPVEGFTNPLWTGWMVLVNLVPLPLAWRSLLVQTTSLVLLLVLVVRVRSLALEHFAVEPAGTAAWFPAAALTGFQYTLAYWGLLGMETILQALLAVLAIHFAYDIVFTRRDRHLALFTVFALAYLVRMDMAILVAVVGGWVLLHGGFRRTERRSWIAGGAVLLAAIVGYQLFRVVYFGEWLPNTYTLKVSGIPLDLRLARGLDKMGESLRENAMLTLVVAAALIAPPFRSQRRLPVGLLLFAYVGYSIWVGGDAWELPEVNVPFNRFVVFLLPLGFVAVGERIALATRSLSPARQRAHLATATVVLLLVSNGLLLTSRRQENLRRLLLVERPLFVDSHALVLNNLQQLERFVAPGAEVVTYWAGIPAYFSSYRMIDAQGYADRHIARQPLPDGLHWSTYVPGHMKRDPEYLLARRPDAFFQFWDLGALPVRWPRHHMRWSGYASRGEFWLRRDSPYLLPGAL